MNLHHLKVFLAVARAGSVSGGAQALHISQPAVTREIRDLESSLGLPLFDRHPRGVTTTEGGQRLLQFAERIFALEQAAERDLRDLAGLGHGELLLGASATLGVYWLPPLLNRFRERHPGVFVSLQMSNTREVLKQLDDALISLGFVEGPFPAEDYAHHLLARDRLLPVVGPAHPLARRRDLRMAELQEHELYLREVGSGARASIEQAYRRHGLEARAAMVGGGTEPLKRLIVGGRGIAWLSQLVVGEELANGRLVQLEVRDLQIERDLHVLWRRGSRLNPAPAALLSLIDSNIKTF